MRKPTVLTKCVANAYTSDNERIIEFSDREASEPLGGLISFTRTDNGRLIVRVYRCDAGVEVMVRDEYMIHELEGTEQ